MRRTVLPTAAGVVVALVGLVASAPSMADADDSCGSRCWEAYGTCYRWTSNRQRCQGQLLRCLSNCIRAKRKATPNDAPPPHEHP